MLNPNSVEKQSTSVMDNVFSIFKAIANWFMSFLSWFSSKKSNENVMNAKDPVQISDHTSKGDTVEEENVVVEHHEVEQINAASDENPITTLQEFDDNEASNYSPTIYTFGRRCLTPIQQQGYDNLKTQQAQSIFGNLKTNLTENDFPKKYHP